MFPYRWLQTYSLCICVLTCMLVGPAYSADPQAKKAAYIEKAEAYSKEGKYAEAVIELKNAVQIDPNDAVAQYKLGLAYLELGKQENFPEALKAFESYSFLPLGGVEWDGMFWRKAGEQNKLVTNMVCGFADEITHTMTVEFAPGSPDVVHIDLQPLDEVQITLDDE